MILSKFRNKISGHLILRSPDSALGFSLQGVLEDGTFKRTLVRIIFMQSELSTQYLEY